MDEKNKPIEGSGWKGMSSAREMRHSLPKIERLVGNEYIGVRITHEGNVTDIYINLQADGRIMHRNSHNTIQGWDTDAYMFGFSYKDGEDNSKFDNLLVANGSYLRHNGKNIISSLSKIFLSLDTKGSDANLVLQGQPIIKLHLTPYKKVNNIYVNGERSDFEKGKSGDIIIRTRKN